MELAELGALARRRRRAHLSDLRARASVAISAHARRPSVSSGASVIWVPCPTSPIPVNGQRPGHRPDDAATEPAPPGSTAPGRCTGGPESGPPEGRSRAAPARRPRIDRARARASPQSSRTRISSIPNAPVSSTWWTAASLSSQRPSAVEQLGRIAEEMGPEQGEEAEARSDAQGLEGHLDRVRISATDPERSRPDSCRPGRCRRRPGWRPRSRVRPLDR